MENRAVIREHGLVGKVSPSRLAVLRYTALKAYENGGTLGLLPDMAVPEWVSEGNVVGIRVNDLTPKALFPCGSSDFANQTLVKEAIIRGILAAVPGLAQDPAYDRNLMDSAIQIDGNTWELVGLLYVTVVFSTGSSGWVMDLLTGKLQSPSCRAHVLHWTLLAPSRRSHHLLGTTSLLKTSLCF